MSGKINILSTKALSLSQIKILDESKFNLTSTDFIDIKPTGFDIDSLKLSSKNWIITSKNSLEIILDLITLDRLKAINFYCVGDKTAQIIKNNQLNLIESKLSSKELGEAIASSHKHHTFSYIAGTHRRPELPNILADNEISFQEFTIYETLLIPYKIEEQFDGILFFSPSGIKSYTSKNTIKYEQIFSIGNTTATEAKKYSNNINIAAEQTIEAVLELTKQHYA